MWSTILVTVVSVFASSILIILIILLLFRLSGKKSTNKKIFSFLPEFSFIRWAMLFGGMLFVYLTWEWFIDLFVSWFSLEAIEAAPAKIFSWAATYTTSFILIVVVVVIILFTINSLRPKKNQEAGGSSDWAGTLIVLVIIVSVGFAATVVLSKARSLFGVSDDVAVHGPEAEERRLSRQVDIAPVPTATESACGTTFAAVKDCKRIAFRNGGTFDYRALTGHCPGYDRKNALNITPIEDGFTHAYSSRYPSRETVVHFYSLKPGQAFLGYTCPS